MEKYESPFNLPDEHMRLVGIITSHWTYNEVLLDNILAEVTDHKYGRIGLFLTNMGYQSKIDLVLAYGRYALERTRPDLWKRMNKVFADLKAANVLRNTYAHAHWEPNIKDGNPRMSVVRTKGGKLTNEYEPVTVEELVEAAKAIELAGLLMVNFFQTEFGLVMPPQSSPRRLDELPTPLTQPRRKSPSALRRLLATLRRWASRAR